VFMITILLVFGEVTPKTIAKRNPEIFAIRVAKIIRFATMIMAPVIWAFLALTRLISKKMGAVENHTLTEDELVVMIDEIEEEGTIEKSERDLIKCAIHFDDIRVNEIYTPRVDIVAASVKVTVEEMKELFIRTEFSRIPIYEETIDRIVGAIYSKDFFAQYVTNSGLKITDIIRPVKFVPENTSIATLLSDLQRSTIHMAIVLDNFGGTLGIVSMEDILEELVGEIWDESDDVKIYVKKEEDGSFTVLGDADMFDVMKEIGLEFNPGEDFENGNVSRFIYHKLEKIPKNGDSIELDNVTIVVKSMKSRRIKEAKFIPREVLPEQ
jgi:putative hemolysin